MLLIFAAVFAVLMALEMQLDSSRDNRIINPVLGFVLTLLVSSFLVRGHALETRPAHIVHMVLYIASLLYVRATVDCALRAFFFPSQ
jgi:hypothetical protein